MCANEPPELAIVVDFDPQVLASSLRALKRQWPRVKAVACGLPNEERAILSSIEAGADGVVLAQEPLAEIIRAVREVRGGAFRVPPQATRPLFDRLVWLDTHGRPDAQSRVLAQLSTRETEILGRLRRGESNKQIAVEMSLELQTVKNHVTRLLRKLRVHNRYDAARVGGES